MSAQNGLDFSSLNLCRNVMIAVEAEGYTTPTPIQAQAIPPLMEGRDLVGVAQTGTGKTAAFCLPILDRIAQDVKPPAPKTAKALILAPTRELAGQIADCVRTYGKNVVMRSTVIYGGAPAGAQIKGLSRGVDVLVATPGRLLDLMSQGHIRLHDVKYFVLDEADRMLDMGFIHDIRKIAAKLPKKHQTVFFSATMAGPVRKLAETLLTDPVNVQVAPQATTADKIEQRVLFVEKARKNALLVHVLKEQEVNRVLIFTKTKYKADRVARHLTNKGIEASSIHGDKAQGQRQRALDGFKSGRVKALVATDIAARGIDVDGVSHVINYELPPDVDNYVHRIGRTARAGTEGIALSFCEPEEREQLRDIQRLIRQTVPVMEDHPYHLAELADLVSAEAANAGSGRGNRKGGPRAPGTGKGRTSGKGSGGGKGRANGNAHKAAAKHGGRAKTRSGGGSSSHRKGGAPKSRVGKIEAA